MSKLTDKDFEGLTAREIILLVNSQHSQEVRDIISEVEDLWDDLYGTEHTGMRLYPKTDSND